MAAHHRRVVTIVAALALVSGEAGAQYVLTGRVVGNGLPVANAEVLVDSLRARTSDSGRFLLHLPVAAEKQVAVRAVGFQPSVAMVNIGALDTTVVNFTLTPVVQTLDSVTVKAQAVSTSPKMLGFEDRRKAGFGYFVT